MNHGAMSGSSRSLPIGWRVTAIMPALEASRMNFIQSSLRIDALSTTSMPALRASAAKASPRAGAAIELAEHDAHHRAGLADHARFGDRRADVGDATHYRLVAQDGASRSEASTPFCKGITAVSGPTIGRIASPALSTSHSDAEQHDIDRAYGSRIVGRPGRQQMGVAARAFDAQALSFIAARWAPRAMKVTSAPPWPRRFRSRRRHRPIRLPRYACHAPHDDPARPPGQLGALVCSSRSA